MGHDRRALIGRAIWSFLGQTASSASNFLLSVLVLSVASASEFAVFAVCLTTYALVLQLSRATVGVPVTLLYSDAAGRSHHEEQRAAVGAGVAIGVLGGALALAAAVLAPGGRAQLVVLGASLPVLLWQDTVRYMCFARGRPSVAAGADSLWIALQLAGSAAVLVSGRASAATLLGVWAGAGAVSASVVGARLGLAPRLMAGIRWGRRHRSLCGRLLAEFMVSAGSHFSVFYGLAIVAGAGQLGRLKAAQTFLGPLVVLLQAGGLLGVPESVRAAHDPVRVRRIAARLSLVLAGGSTACGIVTFLALPAIGPTVFPDTWATARPLIPLLTVFAIALGASTGVTAALRAVGASPWLLRIRTVTGTVLVVLGLAASALFQAQGALVALAAVEGAVAVLAWRRLVVLTASAGRIGPDDARRTHSDGAGGPVPRPDEAGAHPLRPGGRAPLTVVVEGLGPDSLGGPGPPAARPGAGPDHP